MIVPETKEPSSTTENQNPCGRRPNPGNIPGHVGRGFERPDLVDDVPAYCRQVGLDDPSKPKLSMIVLTHKFLKMFAKNNDKVFNKLSRCAY